MFNFRKRINNLIFSFLIVLVGLSGIGLFLYIFYPVFLFRVYQQKNIQKMGFQVKSMNIDKGKIEYFEGGTGDDLIVFVHGYQSDKSYWTKYAKELSMSHKVVAVDLPGHGGSYSPKNEKMDLQYLSDCLKSFVDHKELKNFHLVGTSMGGGVVTLFASQHSQDLKSLVLLNPLGIRTKEKSNVEKQLAKGKNPFFPNNLDELDKLFLYLTNKESGLKKSFKKIVLRKLIHQRDLHRKYFLEILRMESLDTRLQNIGVPALVVIGEKDQVLHPSSSEIYQKNIPQNTTKIISNGSHVFYGKVFYQALQEMKLFFEDPAKQVS